MPNNAEATLENEVNSMSFTEDQLRFPPLIKYLGQEFLTELKELNSSKNLLSFGLSNLDSALNGGITPGVHILAGKHGDERRAFIVHLLDRFSTMKYACIYLTDREHKATIIQKFIVRKNFEHDCNNAIPASQIIATLLNDPDFYQTSLEQISQAVKYVSLVTSRFEDVAMIEERIKYQKQRYDKSVFIIDISGSELADLKAKVNRLMEISHDLQIHVIVNMDLNDKDLQNLVDGYQTEKKIEQAVDSMIIFNRNSTQEAVTLSDKDSSYLLSATIHKNNSISVLQRVFLSYYPHYFYFQEG